MDPVPDLDQVSAVVDPIRRAQLAGQLIVDYQRRITELGEIRQAAIEDAHDGGLTFAAISEQLGLTPGRISQIRHTGR